MEIETGRRNYKHLLLNCFSIERYMDPVLPIGLRALYIILLTFPPDELHATLGGVL